MKKLAIITAAFALSGCAHEYAAYAEAHKARAKADAARYAALAEIAKMGDTTAKVAAVISLNAGGGQQPQQIATPRNWADYALSFTGALLPVVGQMYAVNKQTNLGIRQSDNATLLGISQANSNRDVQTATVTGFSSMAGLGFKAVGDIATVGFKATSDIAVNIKQPQPNITISGTGIVGGGTLTTTTNTMSNSTGTLGTGSYLNDNRPSTSTTTSTSTSTSTSSSLTCTTGPC
jgi:hypothetical protein